MVIRISSSSSWNPFAHPCMLWWIIGQCFNILVQIADLKLHLLSLSVDHLILLHLISQLNANAHRRPKSGPWKPFFCHRPCHLLNFYFMHHSLDHRPTHWPLYGVYYIVIHLSEMQRRAMAVDQHLHEGHSGQSHNNFISFFLSLDRWRSCEMLKTIKLRNRCDMQQ